VLAGEIGLRTLADGSRDFLHALIALIGREDRTRRPDGVQDRKQAAGYDDVKHGHAGFPDWRSERSPPRTDGGDRGPLAGIRSFAAAYAKEPRERQDNVQLLPVFRAIGLGCPKGSAVAG